MEGHENIPQNSKKETSEELSEKFDNLNGFDAVHNTITRELFKDGKGGEEKVLQKINDMEEGYHKNSGFFKIAKMYYEENDDIESALKTADEIQSPEEKTRCLVHLANAVLRKEGNLKLADEITQEITEDDKNYLEYYKKEREKHIENQEG